MNNRPTLAVTLGDVAGIGPEIAAKALLLHPELRDECVPVAIGDAAAMRTAVSLVGRDPSVVRVISDPRSAANDPGIIEIIQTGPSLESVPVGTISPPPATRPTASLSKPARWRRRARWMRSSRRR